MPQQSRRRDPYPWTWEIPLGVVLVILMVLVCGVHLGSEPTEILREHPHAAPYWHGLWQGALHGDDRTAGNRITTVQQAMSLFFQDDIRRRCVPGDGRPATDLADLIGRGGTVYLLGREDPYASASPLMTAVAEQVLETALLLASRSGWGRLCPPMPVVWPCRTRFCAMGLGRF